MASSRGRVWRSTAKAERPSAMMKMMSGFSGVFAESWWRVRAESGWSLRQVGAEEVELTRVLAGVGGDSALQREGFYISLF